MAVPVEPVKSKYLADRKGQYHYFIKRNGRWQEINLLKEIEKNKRIFELLRDLRGQK